MSALAWDAEGHLATLAEAGKTTSYVYDADGNRLISRNGNGSKVLYLPNGTEVKLAAGAATATATRYYTHKDAVVAVRTAGGVDWIVADHQGSAQVTVKATTLAVAKQRSLPFGAQRGSPPGGWPAGYDKGFVGGTKDPTGLTHLGAREYDPGLGRFLSIDPVIDPAQPQQLHPYAYSLNNPATMSDADGQWPKFLTKAASAVASAASTVGNAAASIVTSTVQSIKEDPLKFATGVAVGVVATVAVASVCATGVGCLLLAGAVAGAAAAGAEYGVDVAQGEREFSVGDLTKEMAIGGLAGAVGAGAGVAGGKILSKARGALRGGDDLAEDAAAAGRRAEAGCAHSFAPATAVLMADGSTKPIADIAVGDTVIATDPDTGHTTTRVVTTTWVNQDLDLTDVTVVTSAGGSDPGGEEADSAQTSGAATNGVRAEVIRTTSHHPFWDDTDQEWVPAGDLQPGHHLLTADGSTVTVTAVRNHLGARQMHDLTITDTHTYYVLAGGAPVLVHNTCGSAKPPLIIGENMKRVRQYAKMVGGHAYRPWRITPWDPDLMLKRNTRMIRDAVREGRQIIDIGPDFQQRAAGIRKPGPFYNAERRYTKGYAGYTRVFERWGKARGGVHGLDFI